MINNWQTLSLRTKIAQMIVVRTTGHLFDRQIRYPQWEATNDQLKYWLQELNLGGVILLGGSAAEIALRTQQLQQWANIPLFISADIEEGVGQRFSGATWFPPPMALSSIAETDLLQAVDYAFNFGQITAQEAISIGINWILAPVVDVNNNPLNPVINVRSFGDRQEIVSKLITAFIKGTKSLPVLTTAKHFPGHGDTIIDSHLDLPKITHTLERLTQIELPPFQAAIEAEVDTIMTAHLLIEAIDNKNPATLSHAISTELLREKLNFNGLIVTDALIMGGVANYSNPQDIYIRAIAAGADILLMPSNPILAIESVEKAVKEGLLSEERINQSCQRIAIAKEKIKITHPLEPKNIFINIAKSTSFQQVEEILNKSMKTGGNLPLKQSKETTNLIVIDDLLDCDFLNRQSPAITIPESFGYDTKIIDHRNLTLIQDGDRPFIVQLFVRGNPFRGKAGLNQETEKIYRYWLENQLIVGLIIYGSPYVLDWFKPLLNGIKWIFSYGQMPQSQTIACQELLRMSRNDNLTDGKNS